MFFHRFKESFLLFLRLIRVFWQLIYGAWWVAGLPKPVVSIFGGSKLSKDDPYFAKAEEMAARLIANNISVLTGGGSGVMEAASCGAFYSKSGKGKSIGIGVKGLGEDKNMCVHTYLSLDYFFARKWLLTRFSRTFIVFPGGFGTLDELAELLTLIQTRQMPRIPIVLIGIHYWKPFMNWITESALACGLVNKEDLKLFTVTDDLDKAFCIVRDRCKLSS